jgi:hypothetical protein
MEKSITRRRGLRKFEPDEELIDDGSTQAVEESDLSNCCCVVYSRFFLALVDKLSSTLYIPCRPSTEISATIAITTWVPFARDAGWQPNY